MQLLLIEDNADLAASISDFLESQGWAADWAADGGHAHHLLAEGGYDAVVLDLMLPGIDGLQLARWLREERQDNTPMLILTARDTLEDKLAGFSAGADDYLVKPFSLLELQARLQALLQRGRRAAGELRVADLCLDLDTLEARRGERRLQLTPSCRQLLTVLLRESPGVVSRAALTRMLWGDTPPDSDALRAHIHALRRAVDGPGETPLLHTVPTIGYRLTPGGDT
ncbi:two component transcriptional regulator [Salinisphaera sp. PC39]|uniref:response regulator transcription factor n=1 Tax=Salinisphaera sp. PC39 TaxID=1304156 RepID=UPI003340E69D